MESRRSAVFWAIAAQKRRAEGRDSPDLRGVGDRASRGLFGLGERVAVVRLAAALLPMTRSLTSLTTSPTRPGMASSRDVSDSSEISTLLGPDREEQSGRTEDAPGPRPRRRRRDRIEAHVRQVDQDRASVDAERRHRGVRVIKENDRAVAVGTTPHAATPEPIKARWR